MLRVEDFEFDVSRLTVVSTPRPRSFYCKFEALDPDAEVECHGLMLKPKLETVENASKSSIREAS